MMGAELFETTATGETVREAFQSAVESAQWENGHGGYSGTIAEKSDFIVITPPEHVETDEAKTHYMEELLETADSRVDDKWGPAGAIRLSDCLQGTSDGVQNWLFFGWASS